MREAIIFLAGLVVGVGAILVAIVIQIVRLELETRRWWQE